MEAVQRIDDGGNKFEKVWAGGFLRDERFPLFFLRWR